MGATVWNKTTGEDGKGILTVILPNGKTSIVNSDHVNYVNILQALASHDDNEDDNEQFCDVIMDLLSPINTVQQKVRPLPGSSRITASKDTIFFDGDPVDSGVTRYILRSLKHDARISAGEDVDPYRGVHWSALVKFMENLYQNHSVESRDSLYEFIRRYDLNITADGYFVAYKGLNSDYSSIHNGSGIVNGNVYNRAHLDNRPGNIVEIARSKVNPNRFEGCSTGLHVGSFEYAKDFAQGKLVSVAVNPRDVVSVPLDCEYQKIRVCRYNVLGDVPGDWDRSRHDLLVLDDEDESPVMTGKDDEDDC